MKNIIDKLISAMLVLGLIIAFSGVSKAESTIQTDNSIPEEATLNTEIATEDTEEAEAISLLNDIKGTYQALFPVITDPQYDRLWLDACSAVLGEESAAQMAEVLKAACNGTIYGEEAVVAFGDGSNGAQFDCLFINGVTTVAFDGNVISGTDENGNPVFSHEYAYVSKLLLGG